MLLGRVDGGRRRSSSITDFFNGFNRVPGDSFTGGPTAVADNTGALITPPLNRMGIQGARFANNVWNSTDSNGSPLWSSQSVRTRFQGVFAKYAASFRGWLCEPARINLFLNSNAPVTQNITTTAQQYTVSVRGTGSITLSGTATGTATEAAPLTVTATAGTLTCTVSGSLTHAQVEAGAFKTSPITTAGTSAPRAATVYSRPTAGKLRTNNWMVWGRFTPSAAQAGWLVSFYNDSNNRAGVYAALTGVTFIKIVGGVSTSISALVNQVVGVSYDYQIRQTENEGMAVRFKPDNGPWSAWVTNTTAEGKAGIVVPASYYVGSQAGALSVCGNIPFVMLAQLPHVAMPDTLYDRFPTYDPDNYRDLQVVVSAGEINWYQKGTKTSSYRFTKHKLKRTTVAYNPAAGPTEIHNVDTWNLMEAWEVAKTADYTYTTLNAGAYIANGGAWENAIRERGATNFIGSHMHGNEVLGSVEFTVDGVVKNLATTANYTCKRFTMTQTSTLYRCNTLTPVATRVATWDVTPDGITVTQDITWSANMTIDNAYLAMLPIRRTFDDTDTGAVVTNRGARNPAYAEEDISQIGFSIVNTVGTTAAKAWGTTSGITAELELLETPNFPNNNFHITNAAVYNKMYFDIAGAGHVVTAGDTWRIKARYVVNTSN